MEEIIFRGKLAECENEWIYGYYVNTHDRPRIIYEDSEGYYCEEEVIPETVGQYTGIKDKNDKKIFDGDILTSDCYPFKDGGEPNYNAEVFWSEGSLRFCTELHCVNPNKAGISDGMCEGLADIDIQYKIIGNIYDNSELLER